MKINVSEMRDNIPGKVIQIAVTPSNINNVGKFYLLTSNSRIFLGSYNGDKWDWQEVNLPSF